MAQEGTLFNALTAGSKIVGNITADRDFRIDGTIEGNLVCEGKVVIGESGHIKGDLKCRVAEVMGMIEGNIAASESLALRASATLRGDATTRVLIVEPNAVFNGSCHMDSAAVKK